MNVSIRPLETKDAYISVNWRNTPKVWEYTASMPNRMITIQDELNWITKVIIEPNGRRFAILADGKYIGNTYITQIQEGKGEFHIFIGEIEYWGKGIAEKATKLVIDYAKTKLKLAEVYLSVNIRNKAAMGVYKKLGFVPISKDNDFVTMTYYIKGKKT